jgi:molybdenum cofactor cytidylyltransferase
MSANARPIAAIVPAAGESRRMGQPKLLLEFEGQPLIGRVVTALRAGGADPVVVVAPPSDVPEGPPVAEAAATAGASVISPPTRPREMRQSVELAIGQIGRAGPPPAFLLAPADSPAMSAAIIQRILFKWSEFPGSIIVPLAAGRRAHPIVLPWDLTDDIAALPADQGINAIIAARPERIVEIEVSEPLLADDLDSPGDLKRWRNSWDMATGKGTFALRVRLFAIAKDRAGRSEIEVRLARPATVADLRAALAAQHPALAALAPHVMVAVDSDYAADGTSVAPDSQVALIPPVSGGGPFQRVCP